ncbi:MULTISPECIES: DUF6126 family protein [Streptomycetaceae]|uniref:Small hydrophobic protein n=1 Tax=Streptantibioticus cattleyicolor (strain ATCC 35852 / DSM 46488 / JCM 4925 / NBRC 14057 / NRRL 8057) TaxID=1003195 RepID=F8JZM2_STREN|nr:MULTISPECIES: DUF6126 family protein [Streptomycetaceae]AEW97323.1 hypothetical protein SCATT_49520 [Streptantibioticus cattleyicolor NRRL 8057 = DSM 46488]CCB77645.1 putative small hydrophobic secreted protein [Streptantibioticus cattleyicolor NRRL 8057 = DSM 46488]
MPESPVPVPEDQPQIKALNTRWQNRALWFRIAVYLAGSHLFAAFLFLLFQLGSRHGH